MWTLVLSGLIISGGGHYCMCTHDNVFFLFIISVKASDVPPAPKSTRNEARREFCKKYDGYEHLCDGLCSNTFCI